MVFMSNDACYSSCYEKEVLCVDISTYSEKN